MEHNDIRRRPLIRSGLGGEGSVWYQGPEGPMGSPEIELPRPADWQEQFDAGTPYQLIIAPPGVPVWALFTGGGFGIAGFGGGFGGNFGDS